MFREFKLIPGTNDMDSFSNHFVPKSFGLVAPNILARFFR